MMPAYNRITVSLVYNHGMAAVAQYELIEEGSLAGLPMPITLRPSVRMSDDELIAFSRRNSPYRIERSADGDLEIMSPVVFDGGERELHVASELYLWARQHGGRAFSPNTGFTLPDSSVRSPDACWISETRASSLTPAERRRFAPICPEFVVEVMSESDRLPMLKTKMDMWMANGAQLAWMIDPFAATVSIYRAGAAVEVLARPDWVEADMVVTGFRLETSQLWAK
jgi:Uma2 family endonuclease